MSRLKIKDPNRKRKPKEPMISLRRAALEQLQIQRNQIKEKDDDIVENLIENKVLNKNGSYKHVQNVAKDIKWSTSRVFRSLNRLAEYERLQEEVKKRIEAEMKKAEVKDSLENKMKKFSTPTQMEKENETNTESNK